MGRVTIELNHKRVLVLGLGISGQSAARFCSQHGAQVVAADERPADQLESLCELPQDVRLITGAPLPAASDFDIVVPSPGIPPERYRAGGALVWGDIELAYRALRVPVVAVTGTNGKSTTVLLIESMLDAAGYRTRAAGNVGTPALELAGEPLDVAVIEVSSFQLETVDSFRPRVAVVLNVTPDHLDRHGNFESYCEAKRRVIEAQEPGDVAILNFDDPVVRGFADRARAEIVPISTRGPLLEPQSERAAWLDTGAVVLRNGSALRRISLDSLRLAGRHNLENALAACAAVWSFGADPAAAAKAWIDFRGLPHRCEVVRIIEDVTYVNDSKATNPTAALRSLEGFGKPVIWIAGGRGKRLDFGELADGAVRAARAALLIGETRAQLADALAKRIPCESCEDLNDAVARAHARAKPGDVVLLAPACTSFDQFKSFEERGEQFRRAVEDLASESRR